MLSMIVEPLIAGVRLGLAPNPLYGTIGAIIAAGLAGHRRPSRAQESVAVAILLVAWALGDGVPVLNRVIGAAKSAGPLAQSWPGWLSLLLWALTGLAVGYVAPAVAGVMVGRRVMHGTGRLAAAVVAASISGALSVLLASLG